MTKLPTIPTIGGKTRLLPLLLPIIRYTLTEYSITTFADVFGGGNKILPHLWGEVDQRIYNDGHIGFSSLVKGFTNIDLLREVIDLACFHRNQLETQDNFDDYKKLSLNENMPITHRAAYTLLIQKSSRAADRKTFSLENLSKVTDCSLERYMELYDSMEGVRVFNSAYEALVDWLKNDADTLLYLDPPYSGTNSYAEKCVANKKTQSFNVKHDELAKQVVDAKAKVIISNFDNDYYEKELVEKGWYKYSLGRIAQTSSAVSEKTQKEFIWTNFPIPDYLLAEVFIY